jgi:GDP-L-fucose synthase
MNRDARVYVAGHRGLVGSALMRALAARGFTNLIVRTSAELDLRRQEAVEAFFKKERPEYVFLAAARVGGIVANSSFGAEFIYDNLAIATNVINCAWQTDVRTLLNLGSSCIYPRMAPQPLREEHLLTGPLEPTNEAYAIAKIAAIKLCRYYNQQYGTSFLSAMPANLYGPNDTFDLQRSHVLPALVRKFVLASALRRGDWSSIERDLGRHPLGFASEKRTVLRDQNSLTAILKSVGVTADAVTLWGTGSPLREFLHSDDLAEACLFLVEHCRPSDVGEFVNVGSGVDRSIAEIAELVRGYAEYDGEILWDSSKPDGTPRKLMDVERLRGLGWSARIPFEVGVAQVVRSYVAMSS